MFVTGAAAGRRLLIVSEILFYLYLTLLPQVGRSAEPRLALRSGNFTPPRISPSCPHCLRLWLDRGTIIGGRGHGETACQSRFGMDGTAMHLSWPSFTENREGEKGNKTPSLHSAGGLGASSASLVPFSGSLTDVIQSPDMDLSKYARGGHRHPPHLLSR